MASTCSICLQQGKKSDPTEWCSQCGLFFCQVCAKSHNLSEETKKHDVISYQDFQKLPPFILNTTYHCPTHKERYSCFCRIHDIPICQTCRTEIHEKCDDVPKIEDIVSKVKDSVLFEDTLTELESLCKTLKEVSDDRNKNLAQLKHNYREVKECFEQKFDFIIDHFIKLKQKTLTEMNTVYTELTNDLSNTSQIVQSKEKKLTQILDQREEITRFASNYETFIGIKEMEKMVDETYSNLTELSDNEKLKQHSITFNLDESVETIISSIQSLGDITVTKGSSAVCIQSSKIKEEQKDVENKVPVQLQLHQKLDLKLKEYGVYGGCCILPSGLMVIAADHPAVLSVFNSDGSYRSTIKLKESENLYLYDVTPVGDHDVAVSQSYPYTISMIDVDSGKLDRSIQTRERVTGLCCRGRDLVCCVRDKGVIRVNMDSEEVETLVEDERIDSVSKVKVTNNLVCYTNHCSRNVTVLDSQYNKMFIFQNEEVLGFPRGVAIDEHENIYVTGYGTNNLVVISPDGKSYHALLGKGDGLFRPNAVQYNSKTKQLVVVNSEHSSQAGTKCPLERRALRYLFPREIC